jgi:hypothetical protein
MSDRGGVPALGRWIFGAFLWVFGLAATYILLDSLNLWDRLPAGLTRGVDVATGLVLVGALLLHLVLTTGKLPE